MTKKKERKIWRKKSRERTHWKKIRKIKNNKIVNYMKKNERHK